MTPLAATALSALLLGVAVPLALARLRDLDRWPRLAVWLWITTAIGAIATLAMAALLLLVPHSGMVLDLATLLRTCVMAVRGALAAPSGPPGTLLGLALMALVTGGVVAGTAGTTAKAWRTRRQQRALLALAGQHHPELPGVTLLDHPAPMVYCLAGHTAPVVVTTAALDQLDPDQLAAVLTHERAHQRGHHHLLALTAEALALGFPWLPAARAAAVAVRRLVELAADDAAAGRHGPAPVTTALTSLAAPAPTAATLSAGGLHVAERIHRLLTPPPGRRSVAAAAILLVAGALVFQLAGVAAPLLQVAGQPTCPLTG